MTKTVLRLLATISSALFILSVTVDAHAVKARVLDERKDTTYEEDGVFWKFDTKDKPGLPPIAYDNVNIIDILDTYKDEDVPPDNIVSVEKQRVVNVNDIRTPPKKYVNNVDNPTLEDYQDDSHDDSVISSVVDARVSSKSRQNLKNEKSPAIAVETESKSKSFVIGSDEKHDGDNHAATVDSNRKFNTLPTHLPLSTTSRDTFPGEAIHIRKEGLSLMLKESNMWIGVGAGVGSSLVVCSLVVAIYIIMRKRRGRCSNLKELYIGNPKEDKPIYIKLSQLHRPKRSPNYVVTVLDESNFSVDTDGSSEEELFDLSNITPNSSPYKKKIQLDKNNMTSTPKKINR